MDYVVAILLPQLLHGLVFGAALGLLALGLTVIFGLLGVMNFAHGELYMLGAYAGIAVTMFSTCSTGSQNRRIDRRVSAMPRRTPTTIAGPPE